MSVNWGSLFTVFVVSFGSTVAVVVLVALAVLGRSARIAPTDPANRHHLFSARSGAAVAAACLAAAAVIVLLGLWVVVAR